MTDIAFWPATKLIRALRARKLGALELLEHYAARIAKYDRALNSLCVLDLEAARKAIEAAGGKFFFTLGKTKEEANFEMKFKDPDGVIFDISEKGWLGAGE